MKIKIVNEEKNTAMIALRLQPSMVKKLEQVAKKNKVTISDVIRQLLMRCLENV